MDYVIGKANDVGLQRRDKGNQDSLEVLLPGLFSQRPPLLVLADGMGGYTGGALASRIVTRTLASTYRRAKQPIAYDEVLHDGIYLAQQEMMKRGAQNQELARMGSTIVAAILEEDNLHLVNVGDSRAYLVNQTEIRQISWDHSYVAELVRRNFITPDELLTHPKRNVLTMSISAQRDDLEIYARSLVMNQDDVLVLCSDGLWGPVMEDEIQAVVWELEPQAAANQLVELANRNYGPDNISVIIARNKLNRPSTAFQSV